MSKLSKKVMKREEQGIMSTRESTRSTGYIRVSTSQQTEEGYSLEAQRRKIQAYCDLHDLELMEIIEDAGLSGKSIAGRPGIQRILELVKTGKVDHVVILKLDRLARNVKEACEIADLLQRKSVALHSISEKLDTGSASGRLFYNILSAMSQWEREVIAERTKTALAVKRDNGERISRYAPFGFTFDTHGNLVIDDNEQATIARVQELNAQGYTVRGIVEYLDAHGYRNRAGKSFGVKEAWTLTKRAA
jgi:site-specific DNA recombinase